MMRYYLCTLVMLVVVVFMMIQPGSIPAEQADQPLLDDKISEQLHKWLTTRTFTSKIRVGGTKLYASIWTKDLYAERGYQPLWSDFHGPTRNVHDLVKAIQTSDQEGLRPHEYHFFKIMRLLVDVNGANAYEKDGKKIIKLAALDLLLTDAFLAMALDLAYGRINPDTEIRAPYQFEEFYDFKDLLLKAIEGRSINQTLSEVRPPHDGYNKMRQHLAHYRYLHEHTRWPPIIAKAILKKGMQDNPAIEVLRTKLKILGDLDESAALDLLVFDDAMEQALKRYQKRHALPVTGICDEQTLQLLNLPLDRYIKKMEINMERWRWLPRELGERYILVNIPDYKVHVVEKRKTVLTMPVIVGKQYARTPIFSNKIRFIVLNPYWTIPPNILLRTQLWKIRHDPDYFLKKRIVVLQGWGSATQLVDPGTVDWKKVRIKEFYERYRFTQAPGADNPLGKIKFMFPNEFNVYLHDTNKPELFEKNIRDYSSGCIRVENPRALALYCLKNDPRWSDKKMDAALEKGVERKIVLTKSIPIHILYWTAWVGKDDRLQFRFDIYDRDKSLEKAFYQSPHILP